MMGEHMTMVEAIRANDCRAVHVLIDADPDVVNAPVQGAMTPLMLATYFRRDEIIGILLDRGAHVDIFAAAALGLDRHVRSMLDADPGLVNRHSSDGWTPLHLAAHFGRRDVAEVLLESGADVNARSRNDAANTPLHAAMPGDRLDIALLLLGRGAAVNARQEQGYVALHEAALNGRARSVEALVARGADPYLASDDGETAFSLASKNNHPEVIALLRARDAATRGQ